MTTQMVPRRARRGGSRARRRFGAAAAAPVAVGAVAALVAGGATYALWSSEDSFLGGLYTAGDLNLTTGTPTWSQITAGVSPGAGGQLDVTPAGFLSMPGDVIQIRVPATTTLTGDNLNGGFSVSFANPELLDQDVADGLITTGFHVEDADGNRVAPAQGDAPLGTTVAVPGLVGDDDGETDDWTVVVTVNVLGDYQWVTPATEDFPGDWAAGDMTVRLEQVRTGSGYRSAGGAP